MPKPRVLIAIPSYTASIKWRTFLSFAGLDRDGLDTQLMGIERVIIDRARNVAADAAINGGFDSLLFIDDDMTFEPHALHSLLARDKDVVAGLFFGRVEPSMHLQFQIVKTPEGDKYEKIDIDRLLQAEKAGQCIEVDGTGTGFTLIKTQVLKTLKEQRPDTPLFATIDRGGKGFMSEDIYFCKSAQEVGFHIWVDTAVKVGHIGEKEYGFDTFKANAPHYKDLIARQQRIAAKQAKAA